MASAGCSCFHSPCDSRVDVSYEYSSSICARQDMYGSVSSTVLLSLDSVMHGSLQRVSYVSLSCSVKELHPRCHQGRQGTSTRVKTQ